MMGLPLGFVQPFVLLGLLSLPALWWLLRITPPRPRHVTFPPTRLLFDIQPKEEMPARAPWWLTLLRLLMAALLIFAAAGPLWNPPSAGSDSSRPLIFLLDDGWPAAATWDTRLRTADELIAQAQARNRGVAIVPISENARSMTLQTAEAARVQLAQLKPKPYAVTRTDVLGPLAGFLAKTPNADLVWLSDGTDLGSGADFIAGLRQIAESRSLTVLDGGVPPPRALAGAENAAGTLAIKVLRVGTDGGDNGILRAFDLKGLALGEARFGFRAGEREADAEFDLPVEIRNEITRIEIAGEHSAGAVQLLDKRWRRRAIGIVSGTNADQAQPLLASTFYLDRALGPFADVRIADRSAPSDAVNRFIEQRLPMIILADVGNIAGAARDRLVRWIDDGGVLVRFAGPRLAAGSDDLVPVKLRRGGRVLGGSLTWEQPQTLANFSRESPFNGMAVPSDVTVTRQVLAEPEAGLIERTWATLADGTPLVTAQRRGKGLVVLFHVTADTRWSDLPLSGAFVEMLKRVVGLSGATATAEPESGAQSPRETVAPTRLLNGFGAFGPPPPTAKPIPASFNQRGNADHPPGFYGPAEGLVAVNTLTAAERPGPLDYSGLNARREAYRITEPQDLRGTIFLMALLLLLADCLIVFWLSGGFARIMRRRASVTAAALLLTAFVGDVAGAPHAFAQDALSQAAPTLRQTQRVSGPRSGGTPEPRDFNLKATLQTRLAFVVTGNLEVDNVSQAGLQGLTAYLAQRTALEAGEPMGLDISRDELAFFPLIYWPITPSMPAPSPAALARIDAYMKQGGTVLFDTRDAIMAPPGPGGEARSPGMATLRNILSSLDIPELEPVPREHVLTKTFYLLKDFPGRFNTGTLWVEAIPEAREEQEERTRPARGGDGVSSILITSNDLAGAWAIRPDGQSMLPMAGSELRQREMAYRAGVNIVMYTLTGNYKADQVHIPALLERLGQ
ncbi:MAG: DUF4159 domain-containing protein [Pseudorhodoplanes sp.]